MVKALNFTLWCWRGGNCKVLKFIRKKVLDWKKDRSEGQSVSSVTQSCPTLCDRMNRSMPGLPVHHPLCQHLCYCSVAKSCPTLATPWMAAHQASLSITNSWSLLKLMSIESVMPFNHLILCCPLLLPSVFPSIRVFSNESVLHIRWPKDWSFSFSPSSEYSGLISFRMDWFGSPCSPRDSQESSPTPQFKIIILRRSTFMV